MQKSSFKQLRFLIVAAAAGVLLASGPPPVPAQEPATDEPPALTATAGPPRLAAIVPITGEISDVTTESLERRVQIGRDNGAEVIIFEIDTPGGAALAADNICNFIKNLVDVYTVAWVNTQAISAGSMIAIACDEIVMTPASSIGDCGVLMLSPMGAQAVPEEMRAKAESPVLAQFRDSANRNGYSRLLCEALVIKERVVWWLEQADTGRREFVEDQVKVARVGEGLDPTTQPAGDVPREWKLVESYTDTISGKPITVQQPIVDETELLTMSQSEAVAYGFCKDIVGSTSALKARFNLADDLPRLEFTWSELLVRWMTSMPVRIFLLIIILLGAYIEFHTPGVGVPGLVALICLAIFVGAPYLTGLASVAELVLILLGVLLLIVELFVLPGFGIAGVAGILLVFLGIFLSFVPTEPGPWRVVPQLPATWEAMKSGATAMMIAVAVSAALMWYLARHLPQMPMASQLILSGEVARGQTIDAGATAIETVALEVGDQGVALSVLRPAGKARIRDQVHDVVTEGDMVEKGTPIEVIDVSGNHVVVRKLDSGGDGLV